MKSFIYTFIALVSLLPQLQSQSNILETLNESNFLTNNSKRTIYDDKKENSAFASVTPIILHSIWNFQINGFLEFTLPNKSNIIKAKLSYIEKYSDDDFIWRGDIYSDDNIIGYCLFIKKGDKNFGEIKYNDEHYIIEDLNAGILEDQILIRVSDQYDGGGCGHVDHNDHTGIEPQANGDHYHGGEGGSGASSGEFSGPNGTDCAAEITVLFVYSSEIDTDSYDMEQIAIIDIANLNEALDVSEIPNTNIKAKIVGIELLTDYNENTGNATLILEDFDTDGEFYDGLNDLRDEYDADIVLLFQTKDLFIVNPDLTINNNVAGAAIALDNPEIFKTIGVLDANDILNSVIAHEIGHIFGCRHVNGGHQYANGHEWQETIQGFPSGPVRSTLMNPIPYIRFNAFF
ncbi:MAG: hypothetical protein ACI86M_000965 [Saprospiraceae bacterium]|jgi:hypothetical protein